MILLLRLRVQAIASTSKTTEEKLSPSKKSSGRDKRQDKGSHNGSDFGAKRPRLETRLCKLCETFGGKSDTHNTDVCKKYKTDGTQMSTFGRQQSSHQKLTKMSAKSKKARKWRKYNLDSSNDDSD
jgi:hypothetical protein